ncbi:zinc finger protein 157 isoform X3 [Cephus cinctus]|uniref:Zinc finger protein 157 isoform X3 n=1 Tax=Cephus cinctus TaxID=211228 RepID=A0AAJ7RDG5_CEPCN|nr:zinc finger protein 157 isoform X3 [Cephus cinctus]
MSGVPQEYEMEVGTSVELEACEDESILIQTVKNIVQENEENEEAPEEYFVVTNIQNDQNGQIEVTNTKVIDTISHPEENSNWMDMCRVCANLNDHLIPIFEGEGAEHELCNKIHKYLPIHVSETDNLPLQLCYHCAATLLAWHELAEGCLDAERRLLQMQEEFQHKQQPHDEQQNHMKGDLNEETIVNDTERLHEEMIARQKEVDDFHDVKIEQVEYVECEQCAAMFVDIATLVIHMNTEHGQPVHYCELCKLVYRGDFEDFQQHVISHDNSYTRMRSLKTLEKERLEQSFEEKINSQVYLLQEYNNEILDSNATSKSYECDICGKCFSRKHLLKYHLNEHEDTEQTNLPDEIELLERAKQTICERVSYKCNTCEKVILTKRGFLRHIRIHLDKRPCKCEHCGKCYRIEQDLARHIRDVHEGLKRYVCDICNRPFANKGARDDHRRIHTGERPFACEHCPKTFRTLNSIYIHNRTHTNYKPHKCPHCDKHFRCRQRLNNHLTTHTGVKAFSCEICGKLFSVKGEVMRHRATHNQDKPYVCTSCGLKFGQKRYLRTHIKQHHKDQSGLLLAELTETRN